MTKRPLYCCLLLATLSAHAAPAPLDGTTLDDLFTANHYQIEFFVFERPDVMEFDTVEVLARTGERALPWSMRIQRGEGEPLWPWPVAPETRACLTFPMLTYELEPLPGDTRPAADASDPGAVAGRPVPEIHPILEPDPLLDLMAAVAEFERALTAMSNRWLDAETFLLAPDARRVQRSGLGRVLFHGKWIQDVPPRESPDPILIQGGQQLVFPTPVHELEGTVGVTLGRFLHFRADLFFHAPALGVEPIAGALSAAGREVLDPAPPLVPSYMQLSESRRMRSEEIHYLDHPKLGLVVRIDPVEIPQTLLEAFDTLKEGDQQLGD